MTDRLIALKQYIGECARLLYWVYFKPFTFQRWLREIDPDLTLTANPFELREEFNDNPFLKPYADQILWSMLITPWLLLVVSTLSVAIIYLKIPNVLFNTLLLSGWSFGLWLFIYHHNITRIIFSGGYLLCVILAGVIWWRWHDLRQFLDFLIENEQLIEHYLLEHRGLIESSFVLILCLLIFLLGTVPIFFAFIAEDREPQQTTVLASGLLLAIGVSAGVAGQIVGTVTSGAILGLTVSFAYTEAPLKFLGVVLGAAIIPAIPILLHIVEPILTGSAPNTTMSDTISVSASFLTFGMSCILGSLRFYFWLPEFLVMLGLKFRNSKQQIAQYLRYLPPRFDELIILPLPFMDRLIIEAHRHNPALAQQTIFYLINSTNQQQVAAQAIVGIALEQLNQCRTEGEIGLVAQQLNWLPDPPPTQLGTALPQLVEISRDVNAASNATSAYRHAEQLARPIQALERLQTGLSLDQQVRSATLFGSIVQSWLKILQLAQTTLRQQTTAEIPTAYVAGSSLEPPVDASKDIFRGREDLMRQIEQISLTSQPPVLLLSGGRRTGKTSLLKYLPQRVSSELIPLYVDLQGAASATTLRGFATSLASQITEAARRARNFQMPVQPDPYELERDPFLALQQWLEQLERRITNRRFLLCLDEFERLEEFIADTGKRAPLNFLRHVMQHRRQWILLFSGSHSLDELAPYWSDYLINTETIPISYLDPASARDLILHPIADFPEIYDPDAVDRILELTHCQPYLVQMLCSKIVDLLNQEQRWRPSDRATIEDVDRVIERTLIAATPYFQELWKNTLTSAERHLLKRILQGEFPQPEDQPALRKLIRREILHAESYSFQVPLVQRYIEQQN